MFLRGIAENNCFLAICEDLKLADIVKPLDKTSPSRLNRLISAGFFYENSLTKMEIRDNFALRKLFVAYEQKVFLAN